MRHMLPVATPLLVLAPAAGLLWAMGRNARMRVLVSRLVPRFAASIVLGEARMEAGLRPCVAVALDMAGSTAFQNTHGAERFAARQSALYARFSECLAAQGGHVIKYTGDGVMAVFFAEADRGPDHLASAAVAALRAFAKRWRTLAEQQQARGEPAIAVRIGLEAGNAQLSITETPDRLIVDAAGEPLNVAARLESFAKTVAGEALVTIIAGERVARALGEGAPNWEPLGSQSLRGVEASVRVHRLVV
jgi:adenylate cyclase